MRRAELNDKQGNAIGEDAVEAYCTSGTSPPAAALTLTPEARARLSRYVERRARSRFPGACVTVTDRGTG
jgi:hypothetical protein